MKIATKNDLQKLGELVYDSGDLFDHAYFTGHEVEQHHHGRCMIETCSACVFDLVYRWLLLDELIETIIRHYNGGEVVVPHYSVNHDLEQHLWDALVFACKHTKVGQPFVLPFDD